MASETEFSQTMNKRRRGPDELGAYSVGNGFASTSVDSNGSKKVRLEYDAPPSKVVHIRNVPNEATENDIALLGVPFGSMDSMVLSKKVNQALLQMADLEMAVAMVNYYSSHPPNMYGRTVIIQFSKHKQLETKNGNLAVESAIQSANQMASSGVPADTQTVLRVIVENLYQHVINYLILYKIFIRFGRVARIVIFNRNGQFQALIEMEDGTSANAARLHLNGQNIYTGCCTLRIDFSKLKALDVRNESEKCRDFIRTPLTDAEKAALGSPPLSGNSGAGMASVISQPQNNFGPPPGSAGSYGQAQQSQPLPLFAAQFSGMTNPGSLQYKQPGSGPGAGSLMQMSHIRSTMFGGNSVLLVSNLDEDRVTPDALFTLFGVYGDVIRVKIMFNKKDTALIQFSDAQQAQLAIENLQGVRLWSRALKIAHSKHNQVQMPREGSDQGYTKDFTNAPLHRFKQPNSKNFMNIFPPSPVLHLSNLPPTISEDEVKDLFEEHGYNVVNFKFMQKEKKMAFIQLESIELSVEALIELHNWPLSDTSHLRVSFSKATL